MRDYKNVRVPKKYRASNSRVSVKRADSSRTGRRPGKGTRGIRGILLNILGLALVTGICWAGWHAYRFMTRAGLFQISGIDVKGVSRLGEADLKKIAGDFTGQNIFHADLEGAARRARQNPWIKDARIHRSLPNRITISLIERVPCAVLVTKRGRYLIDNEAMVVERIEKGAGSGGPLPSVVIRDYAARPGEPVTAESIPGALTLLAEIEARGGWEPADIAIRAGSAEALSVVYRDHVFKMGSGMYAEKLRRLGEVMADVKQRGMNIAYVDLRPERQAAVMPVKSGRADSGKSRGKVPDTRHAQNKRR